MAACLAGAVVRTVYSAVLHQNATRYLTLYLGKLGHGNEENAAIPTIINIVPSSTRIIFISAGCEHRLLLVIFADLSDYSHHIDI